MPKIGKERPEQIMEEEAWMQFFSPGAERDLVNLRHGFPQGPPPDFLLNALQNAISCSTLHQYTRSSGHPRLVSALSIMYSRLTGRNIDPEQEILVTVGAIQALYTSFFALVNPGEEVILIEPFFTPYERMAASVGAVPVFVPLRTSKQGVISSADWVLDQKELASKFNLKTKLILINNPHNPLGKVGWAYGPEQLLKGLMLVHQYCVSTVSTLMQEAVAVGLEKEMDRIEDPEGYWSQESQTLQKKRDFICGLLKSLGVAVTMPQGAYFIVCDFSKLASKLELRGNEDVQFLVVEWLCRKKKLMTAPGSIFYGKGSKSVAKNFVRICFARDNPTLERAADILERLKTN